MNKNKMYTKLSFVDTFALIHCDAPTRNGHDFMTPGVGSQHRAQMYTGNRHQPRACPTMVYKFISSSGTRSTKPHKFETYM